MQKKKVAIFNDTSKENHYGCYQVMSVIFRELNKNNIGIEYTWPVGMSWKNYIHENNIDQLSAIIINGEGSIHNTLSNQYARKLLDLALFSKQNSVPCYLINATLYNIGSSQLDNLRLFSRIYVRDEISKKLLQEHNIDSHVVPDLSFFYNLNLNKTRGNKTLVTDSFFGKQTEILKNYANKNNFNFLTFVEQKKIVFRILNKIVRVAGKLHLFDLKNKKYPQSPRRFSRFKKFYNNANLVITGRYHATTTALSNGIPVACFESNTPKISFLLQDIFKNTARLIKDIESIELEGLSKFTDEESRALNHYISDGEIKMKEMFSNISEDID